MRELPVLDRIGAAATTAVAVPIVLSSALVLGGVGGVTFVEVIAVLVVIAPLAALLVLAAVRWWLGRRPAILTIVVLGVVVLWALLIILDPNAGGTWEAIVTTWMLLASVVGIGAAVAAFRTRGG